MNQLQSWERLDRESSEAEPYVKRFVVEESVLAGYTMPGNELREQGICSFSCLALETHLKEQGYDASRLLYPDSLDDRLNDILGRKMIAAGGHVVVQVEEQDRTFIADPSYSQYLSPFGLSWFVFEDGADLNPFPKENILVFPADEVEETVDWLCTIVERFWSQHTHHPSVLSRLINYDWNYYTNMPREQMKAYFMALYDLDQYQPFTRPEDDYYRTKARKLLEQQSKNGSQTAH